MKGESEDDILIQQKFRDEKYVSVVKIPWYGDIVKFLVCGRYPPEMNYQSKKRFLSQVKYYYWEEPLLYRNCSDGLFRRCVPEDEKDDIMKACHSSPYGGHFGPFKSATKVLQSGFYWPTIFRDVRTFVSKCDACQRTGTIGRRDEMPMSGVIEV